jgi:hypothetical protein
MKNISSVPIIKAVAANIDSTRAFIEITHPDVVKSRWDWLWKNMHV